MIKAIYYESSFKKSYKHLPKEIKKKFRWCLGLIVKEEKHNSLRNKKVQGVPDLWEFSITMNYRCLYYRVEAELYLVAIGKHEDVF